jgi:bifunctional non-homologous end joining protein LigD
MIVLIGCHHGGVEPDDALAAVDDDLRHLIRDAGGPQWRQPMLATLTDARFSDPAWIFERKLDGVRVLVVRDGDDVTLWSRNHKPMNAAYPELVEAFAAQQLQGFVADGEIVAFEGDTTSFSRLQGRIHITDPARARRTGIAVYCYLFDLMVLGTADLTRLPLRARKQALRAAFTFDDPLRFSAHRNTDGEAFYDEACRHGWEGLIAKRAASTYTAGRSRDWLKLKCGHGQEFVVGGFTEPRGMRIGFGALLLGYYQDGELRYAGKVGTGYDTATLRGLRARLDELEQPDPPFTGRVHVAGEAGVHWTRPELVAEVAFSEWTGDGRLRHPRFEGLRTDKAATDVVREAPR